MGSDWFHDLVLRQAQDEVYWRIAAKVGLMVSLSNHEGVPRCFPNGSA
jgi:hypothetical protein